MSALYCVYALQVAVRSRFDRLVEKSIRDRYMEGLSRFALTVSSIPGRAGAIRARGALTPPRWRSSGSLTASLALLAHSLSVGVLQPIPYSLRSVRSSTVGSCSTAEPFAGPGSAQPPRDRPAAPAVVSAAPCAAERTTSAITAEVVRARRPRRSRDAS